MKVEVRTSFLGLPIKKKVLHTGESVPFKKEKIESEFSDEIIIRDTSVGIMPNGQIYYTIFETTTNVEGGAGGYLKGPEQIWVRPEMFRNVRTSTKMPGLKRIFNSKDR